MAPHVLFSLPDDAVRAASVFLEQCDLVALTGVSTEARRSHFKSLCDARPTSLVLPPTDRQLAERLLRTLHDRDPLRLSKFTSVVLATLWHVDLLVDEELTDQVHSVRLVQVSEEVANSLVNAISRKLTHVRSLDLPYANLKAVSPLASMTQLRHLTLRQVNERTLFLLRSLKNLEELVLERVQDQDMSFLMSMHELRVLKIHALKEVGGRCCGDCRETDLVLEVPILRGLDKLHTLSLIHCSFHSVENVLSAASRLQRLTIYGVETRYTHSTDAQILAAVRERAPHVELNSLIGGESVASVAKSLVENVSANLSFLFGCSDF